MPSDEFRREIRTDPATGRKIIVLPDLKGDVHSYMTTPIGDKIDFLSINGTSVSVLTPEVPLFLLEERGEVVGDGAVYDRSSAFGADERLNVDVFSPSGLEALLKSFKSRSIELHSRATNKDSLTQFFPYFVYVSDQRSLTGILLASRAIPPVILSEIEKSENHAAYHSERYMYCDIRDEEKRMSNDSESRFVTKNMDYIAFTPFAPSDQHGIHILPFKHIPRFEDLSDEQIRNLAMIVYESMRRIQIVAKDDRRHFDIVNVVLHSAPNIIKGDKTSQRTRYLLERIYHFHVEISPGQNPMHGSPYEIPFSGWTIVAGRPKDTAYKLRQALNHHS